MARIKKKDWKATNFSLDVVTIDRLKAISEMEGLSNSEMIDFLVHNWEAGIDVNIKLKQLQDHKNILQEQLKDVDSSIDKIIKQISLIGEWNKQKVHKKKQAIDILSRLMRENRELPEIEKVAMTWQRLTGITPIELLMEARELNEKQGI